MGKKNAHIEKMMINLQINVRFHLNFGEIMNEEF